jgi:hypothetical protein
MRSPPTRTGFSVRVGGLCSTSPDFNRWQFLTVGGSGAFALAIACDFRAYRIALTLSLFSAKLRFDLAECLDRVCLRWFVSLAKVMTKFKF